MGAIGAKQGIIKTVQTFVVDVSRWLNGGDPEKTEQAMSMPDIYSAVGMALNDTLGGPEEMTAPYQRLIDCYLDGSEVYAIVAKEGKLYKTLVSIIPGGVTLGDMAQVEIDYKPVGTQQSFKVIQQANGQYRWFAFPAATAVLNRNGYLNSRALYDNFVQHISNGAPMPYLTFYHVGDHLVLGQADFVERDGYALLVSGLFNDTPLAQRLAQASEYNGVSIGFLRNPEAMQSLTIDETVKIPVDIDGVLLEVSAMAEKDAACLMTVFSSKGVQIMDQNVLKKLKTLAGDDPAALAQVEALANHVDQTNQTIEDENLVRQAQAQAVTEEPSTLPETTTEPATPAPVSVEDQFGMAVASAAALALDAEITKHSPTPQEILLTDEVVQAIAERVRSGFATELTAIQTLTDAHAAMIASVGTLTASMTGLQSRLDALEKSDQAKVQQALVDMPRNSITVGFQPRKQVQATAPTVNPETDADAIAQETLTNLRSQLKMK